MAAVAGTGAPNFNQNVLRSNAEGGRQRPTTPRSPGSPGAPPDDAMDVSPTTTSAMGPPNGMSNKRAKSPDGSKKSSAAVNHSGGATQNTKVVQTAFVHKLYQMLEDPTIQHLITWSSSEDSFLISPSTDFSKVLATYFKHTNVSSFVRQLNMYGFHKVSDVFHTGSPETPLWEFKHGGGSFKKGDLDSLRDIKRRASRHTLMSRDSFSNPQKQPSQPPPLPEASTDSTEARLELLERNLYDMHSRLTRSEEQNTRMAAKYQDLTEKLTKSYQHNQELSGHLASLVEDPNHPVRRSISLMQNDIGRHLDAIRAAQASETHSSNSSHDRSYPQRSGEIHTGSPAPAPYDDRRRASIQVLPSQHHHRPIAPSPIRHGSVTTGRSSPVSSRLAPPPPTFSHPMTPPLSHQAPQIPAVAIEPPPYIPRRHTSADIHSSNSWPPPPSGMSSESQESQPSGPFASYASSYMTGPSGGDRQIQDKLASYSFGSGSNNTSGSTRQRASISNQPSRGSSPPPPPYLAPPTADNAWSAPPPIRMPFRDVFKSSGVGSPGNSSAPTRRSSMANIHNMLNPADTAEAEDEDEHARDDPRKRKRLT